MSKGGVLGMGGGTHGQALPTREAEAVRFLNSRPASQDHTMRPCLKQISSKGHPYSHLLCIPCRVEAQGSLPTF